MKILLDASPAKIKAQSARLNFDFGQLRTPISRHRIAGVPYAVDNGCFSAFQKDYWLRLLREAEAKRPIFVSLPDIVGDARRTMELFGCFERITNTLPRALVLQDGISGVTIPWEKIQAVFVGGTDAFKVSAECMNALRCAKILEKWVHVGRVNSPARVEYFRLVADSIDGSGLSKFDETLQGVVSSIKNPTKQERLF